MNQAHKSNEITGIADVMLGQPDQETAVNVAKFVLEALPDEDRTALAAAVFDRLPASAALKLVAGNGLPEVIARMREAKARPALIARMIERGREEGALDTSLVPADCDLVIDLHHDHPGSIQLDQTTKRYQVLLRSHGGGIFSPPEGQERRRYQVYSGASVKEFHISPEHTLSLCRFDPGEQKITSDIRFGQPLGLIPRAGAPEHAIDQPLRWTDDINISGPKEDRDIQFRHLVVGQAWLSASAPDSMLQEVFGVPRSYQFAHS